MVGARRQDPSQWSGRRGNLEESVAGMNGGGQELAGEPEPDNKTPVEACWLHDWIENRGN